MNRENNLKKINYNNEIANLKNTLFRLFYKLNINRSKNQLLKFGTSIENKHKICYIRHNSIIKNNIIFLILKFFIFI